MHAVLQAARVKQLGSGSGSRETGGQREPSATAKPSAACTAKSCGQHPVALSCAPSAAAHLPNTAIYTATTVLSLVIANNAAAAIVFPIAATVAVKVSGSATYGCGWHVHSLVLCRGE